MKNSRNPSSFWAGSLWSELRALVDAPFACFPGRSGVALRRFWFGRRFQSRGRFSCATGCEFLGPGSMHFEGTTWISRNSFFTAEGGSIRISDDVWIGANAVILGGTAIGN